MLSRIHGQVVIAVENGEFEQVVQIVRQFFDSSQSQSPTAPKSVLARMLNAKGYAHENLGEFDAAFSAWDNVAERFGTTNEPDLQSQVAFALANKGVALAQLGKLKSAIAVFDEIVDRFGTNDFLEVQLPLSTALVGKGELHGRLGQIPLEMASVQRSDCPLRSQRHTATPSRSRYRTGLQGNHAGTTWRSQRGNCHQRRGARPF